MSGMYTSNTRQAGHFSPQLPAPQAMPPDGPVEVADFAPQVVGEALSQEMFSEIALFHTATPQLLRVFLDVNHQRAIVLEDEVPAHGRADQVTIEWVVDDTTESRRHTSKVTRAPWQGATRRR